MYRITGTTKNGYGSSHSNELSDDDYQRLTASALKEEIKEQLYLIENERRLEDSKLDYPTFLGVFSPIKILIEKREDDDVCSKWEKCTEITVPIEKNLPTLPKGNFKKRESVD